MAEYIDKQAFNDAIREAVRKYPNTFYNGLEVARQIAHDMDAADVQPVVKAHFELVDVYSITALGYDIKGLECSNCGATFIAQSWVKRFNYCPNCGAKMDGGET